MDELFQKDNTAKWDADRLYAEARAELSAGNWVKAREYYQKLEARYPFGRHAQQALMEIAYTYYKEGETAQAVQTADRFIRQYPNNPNVDYMYYLKPGKGSTVLQHWVIVWFEDDKVSKIDQDVPIDKSS